MRIIVASMPVLALLSSFALGASSRVEARVNKECDGTYLTPALRYALIKIRQHHRVGWDELPS